DVADRLRHVAPDARPLVALRAVLCIDPEVALHVEPVGRRRVGDHAVRIVPEIAGVAGHEVVLEPLAQRPPGPPLIARLAGAAARDRGIHVALVARVDLDRVHDRTARRLVPAVVVPRAPDLPLVEAGDAAPGAAAVLGTEQT